jgi:hypothetical protein
MRHGRDCSHLALDRIEAPLDAALRGEDLFDLCRIRHPRRLGSLKADHAAATDHRSTDQ